MPKNLNSEIPNSSDEPEELLVVAAKKAASEVIGGIGSPIEISWDDIELPPGLSGRWVIVSYLTYDAYSNPIVNFAEGKLSGLVSGRDCDDWDKPRHERITPTKKGKIVMHICLEGVGVLKRSNVARLGHRLLLAMRINPSQELYIPATKLLCVRVLRKNYVIDNGYTTVIIQN